ncbi:MAG: trigger factor, partial [Planctomycetota bacterium]|nr:trigger factor [Planctomycetota bacterium]
LESFDELVTGVKAGEEKTTQVTLSNDIENEELRGEELELTFSILDVKQQNTPELTAEVLESYGVENEEKLREAVRSSLERQVEYQAGQKLRQQISSLLTGSADWDLPPDLLRRQFRRELERSILELRSSGFDESMIRAYENDLRQNTMANTRTSLQEHFILERIAEEEGIEDDPQDYDLEIAMIAMQQNDSPRRVRAHLERRGQMDALRNQIIERKVLERIKSEATFKEVEYELPNEASEGVEFSLVGAAKDSDIPEAKYSEDAPSTPGGSSKTS